jgi:hypothetical protein
VGKLEDLIAAFRLDLVKVLERLVGPSVIGLELGLHVIAKVSEFEVHDLNLALPALRVLDAEILRAARAVSLLNRIRKKGGAFCCGGDPTLPRKST